MELTAWKTSIRLVVIILFSINFRVSRTEKYETATIDQDPMTPEIEINQGTVRSVILSTRKNRTIVGYLGIPYAEPPIGNLRFKDPVPANGWTETLEAVNDSPDCPQVSNDEVIGNEDCLYLNVYTPRLSASRHSELLPVMVFVHGGAFSAGSNNHTEYGPGYLLDKDLILVVISYRLGVLGFLSTGDEESLGNWGLKDQVLSLKWVRDNIEFFGGDPNRVTLSGHSAGSMSVNHLVFSNSTIGLFRRYIIQSGPGSSTTAYQDSAPATANAFKLGEYLGCPTSTSTTLIKCLKELEFTKLVDTVSLFTEWSPFPTVLWEPTIEPDVNGALLINNPIKLAASGKIRGIPRMLGSVSEDGLALTGYFYANPDKYEEFLSNSEDILPYMMNYHNKMADVDAFTTALKTYFINNYPTSDKSVLLSSLTQFFTDIVMKTPNYQHIQQVAGPSYLYSFEYRGTFSYSYEYTGDSTTDYGVAHGDELIYLFPETGARFGKPNATMSEADFEMVDIMVELWTSFVINGEPVSTALPRNQHWCPYLQNMDHLKIGNDVTVSLVHDSHSKHRMEFLLNITEAFLLR